MKPWVRWVAGLCLALWNGSVGAYYAQDGRIFDAAGSEVRVKGLSWFGFETSTHVVHGLWARNWKEMIAQMKSLGFNTVRLPLCPKSYRPQSPPLIPSQLPGSSPIDTSKNPDLAGKTSLEILDLLIAELDRQGLYILLDQHRHDCQTISELWYASAYSEADWISDLVYLANRYRNVPHLIGLDLKNEPHGAATWGATHPATDWNRAAERAAQQVLVVAPHWLMFVQGVASNSNLDCSSGSGHWWGGNLEPLACHPLDPQKLPPQQLVLSPHVYGPDVYAQSYFSAADFPANMPAIWDQHFGYLRLRAYSLVIGEFGGQYGNGGGDPADRLWQDALVDYLIDRGITNTIYWSWNPNSGDTAGILKDDWQGVWDNKMVLLRRLWDAAVPSPADTDGDGVPDARDNCRAVANADQRDTDNDGYGNLCDADLDNSGAVNFADLAIMKSMFFTADAQADLDGDGTVNFADLAIMKQSFFKAPGPGRAGN